MEISYIQKKLNKINIQLDISTLQQLKIGGFMSKVYSCNSNKGNLILHIITPVPEQVRQKTYQKIYALSKILKKHKEIATAKIYLFGTKQREYYFTVQKLLPGENMGDRIIERGEIINRYFKNNKKLLKPLEEVLIKLHSIKLSGYGFLQIKNG